ncbi:acyl-CoA dehydrogenase family protein [Novosphingobium sp.]|uniref:acyl-CoA dehydrogenase family protein n=1 Tax=Novosphingobium sp. TaxID=1874826 RepID=UPI001EB5F09E|nr:acyl-CoA dehydrogenase family protein [Novosphingobium sp.]MBK9010186.1 acyl-CoA dehydrogenase family protein [Novosphingobium sp.]
MDFVYSDEQQMLRDAAIRYGGQAWSVTDRIANLGRNEQWSRQRWAEIAEMGWLMLAVPEDRGGLGGNPADVMALAEGLGRNLVASPFVTNGALVPALLTHAGEAGDEVLVAIMAGTARAAAGLIEPDAGYNTASVATEARLADGAYRLNGAKAHVEDGGDADWFVVSARTGGGAADRDGISLFLVARDAPGLVVERFRSVDQHRHARLRLDGVPAIPVAPLDEALPIIEAAVDRAICAHLAEAVGSMEAASEATLEYLRTRHQFGVPIGSFQVLQHRAVDMAVFCEEARSITCWATLSLDHPRLERRRAVSAAKVRVGQAGLHVTRDAVQLHGGIGVCEELLVSHHLRRQMMLEFTHGTSDMHIGLFEAANRALLAQPA